MHRSGPDAISRLNPTPYSIARLHPKMTRNTSHLLPRWLKVILKMAIPQRQFRLPKPLHFSPSSSILSQIRHFHSLCRHAPGAHISLYTENGSKNENHHASVNPLIPRTSKRHASRRFTRQERIDEAKYTAQLSLIQIDEAFDIFGKNVSKVVDLGSAPGTWLRYARHRLLHLHGTKPTELYKKCILIGVDILFFQPPEGVFYTQGNIYSQNTHTQVEDLLRESTYRLAQATKKEAENGDEDVFDDVSYILKELSAMQLEHRVQEMAKTAENCNSDTSQDALLGRFSHQADLVLSDLGRQPLQETGFHINTLSKPYMRTTLNPALRLPWDDPQKSSIDMAEAALLLCGGALAKNGNFVLRLSMVDLSDPELLLLEQRLSRVFHHVTRWSHNGRIESERPTVLDLFMICQGKKDHTIDKYEVFGVKRPKNA